MQCPICYEGIDTTVTLSCSHIVHDTCIIATHKAQCPICRAELPELKDKIIIEDSVLNDYEPTMLDKFLSAGYLKSTDIPFLDMLCIEDNDKLALTKAMILLLFLG